MFWRYDSSARVWFYPHEGQTKAMVTAEWCLAIPEHLIKHYNYSLGLPARAFIPEFYKRNRMILEVTDETFEAEVLQSFRPVIVKFYADWCQPCKRLTPILEKVATEFVNAVKVVSVNAETTSIAEKYGVTSVPTLKFFARGTDVLTLTGAKTEGQIIDALDEVYGFKSRA